MEPSHVVEGPRMREGSQSWQALAYCEGRRRAPTASRSSDMHAQAERGFAAGAWRGSFIRGTPGQVRKMSKRGNKSLSHRAALGFCAGLMGLALLSACSPTEGLLTPTPAIFAAPQDRAPVEGAQPLSRAND